MAKVLFEIGGFEPGKSVLWHSGASLVSIAGIQMSAANRASAIYSTLGPQDSVDFCTSLGATEAWDSCEQDWAEKLDKVTDNKGVDIIFDFEGQSYFQRNINSIAMDGRLVILGMLSGSVMDEDLDLGPLVRCRIKVEGSRLHSSDLDYHELVVDRFVKEALPKLVDGSFKVPIERVFDWKDIREAYELLESNTVKGKIICKVI